jgi:uncharacterized protein (DUF488 family)
MIISTIGYEGLDTDRFLRLLAEHGVETVVDVRATPISRKPGFSKTVLRNTLSACGFGYVHMRALGCPKDIRDRYREDGDWATYCTEFRGYLALQGAAVSELAALARSTHCALLCFEADPNYCHRSMVASATATRLLSAVRHIASLSAKKAPVALAA